MPPSEDERIADLEAALSRDDPRFVRALGVGRPREYRRGGPPLSRDGRGRASGCGSAAAGV